VSRPGEGAAEDEVFYMSSKACIPMLEPDAAEQLASYGIPYPEHGVADDAEEAAAVAERIGYPVVLKVVATEVSHKSDAGGVAVGLVDAAAVRKEYVALLERVRTSTPGLRTEKVLVCRQAPEGLEAIVGAVEDPVFGPTVLFGLGGIFAEVINDVTFRIAPLELADAQEMIREIKGYPLLTGARGRPPVDVEKLASLLLSISRLVTEQRDIAELDLNPVVLYSDGLMALDARIMKRLSGPEASLQAGPLREN
jgi:acyl-CoA synthetase (NDP forming)